MPRPYARSRRFATSCPAISTCSSDFGPAARYVPAVYWLQSNGEAIGHALWLLIPIAWLAGAVYVAASMSLGLGVVIAVPALIALAGGIGHLLTYFR
jgi:hypothetical protein